MPIKRDDHKRANKNSRGRVVKHSNPEFDKDLKDILEDAKDGRVKKATRKKINDILDNE